MRREVTKTGGSSYSTIHVEKPMTTKPKIVKEFTAGGIRMYTGVGKMYNAELYDKAFGKPAIGK